MIEKAFVKRVYALEGNVGKLLKKRLVIIAYEREFYEMRLKEYPGYILLNYYEYSGDSQ